MIFETSNHSNKFTLSLYSWSATKKKEKIKHQTHPIIIVLVVDIEVPAKLHVTIKFLCDGNTHLVLFVVMTMMTTMMMMVMVMITMIVNPPYCSCPDRSPCPRPSSPTQVAALRTCSPSCLLVVKILMMMMVI